MKTSFVLLAHESPESLKILVETLLSSGSDMIVHYDGKSNQCLNLATDSWHLERFPGRLFHAKRVNVSWGEWSIVQATLNCLRLARQQGYNADYFVLLSGSCFPTKPIYKFAEFLSNNSNFDFIEAVNALEKRWITRGIQNKRWEKFHYLNWRSHPKLFDLSLRLQERLNIKRKLPLNHTPFMGSQWWCLRTSTIDTILSLLDNYSELISFYRKTWVPDELFFQTMVGNLIPPEQINAEILTRYQFNSWGVPRVYYNDNLSELLAENTFFARKISHRAKQLRQSLSDIYKLPKRDYESMIADPNNELAVDLRKQIELSRELRHTSWFSLTTSHENEYDYIKSIPNPMVVVVSANKRVRNTALAEFEQFSNTVVYGDILGAENTDFRHGVDRVAGYGIDCPILAQHKWHLFLGELAFRAKGKTLVFSLGEEPLSYLKILRWKANLTVIMLDEAFSYNKQDESLASIYFNSQVCQLVGKDSNCQFARLPFDLFIETTRSIKSPFFSPDDFSHCLSNISTRIGWPSLRRDTDNRYDFMKSIPNAMLIVYASDEASSISVLKYLQQRPDVVVYYDVFDQISIDRADVDWHYYLGDLAHFADGKMVVFSLDPKHVFYLETLRWKKNLAVLVVDNRLFSTLPTCGLSNLLEVKHHDVKVVNAWTEMNFLLQDKHCQSYYMVPQDLKPIDDIVEMFYCLCRPEYGSATKSYVPRYSKLHRGIRNKKYRTRHQES